MEQTSRNKQNISNEYLMSHICVWLRLKNGRTQGVTKQFNYNTAGVRTNDFKQINKIIHGNESDMVMNFVNLTYYFLAKFVWLISIWLILMNKIYKFRINRLLSSQYKIMNWLM